MGFTGWADSSIKKMNIGDIQLIKLSAAGFALMIAKLWEPLLALDWYWYALLFVLAAAKPMHKVLKSRRSKLHKK